MMSSGSAYMQLLLHCTTTLVFGSQLIHVLRLFGWKKTLKMTSHNVRDGIIESYLKKRIPEQKQKLFSE